MKIIISGNINYYSFNGQTIFMKNLAEGLARRGNDVLLYIPANDGKARQFTQNGVRIHMTGSISLAFLHPDAILSTFSDQAIRQVFKEFKPDIVHIHDHYPLSVAIHRCARKLGVKIVGTNHFMPENLAPHIRWISNYKREFDWLMWQWMLYLYNRLDAVTAPSRTAVNILRKNGLRTPVCPVSNGVDMNIFHRNAHIDKGGWRERYGFKRENMLFLYVGRVDGEKRLDVILKAMALLKRRDIQFGIVGKGTDTERLKKMSCELDIEQQVHFTGFIPDEDLPSMLNISDVFTMPSEAELQSIASLEAMACGNPMLAANSQALPELVSHGYNGFLFEAGNPASAAQWLAAMADRPLILADMSAASMSKVEIHSIDNTLYNYEKLFEKAMTGSPIPQLNASYTVKLNKVKSQP